MAAPTPHAIAPLYQPATGCALLVCMACGVGIALLQLAAEVPS